MTMHTHDQLADRPAKPAMLRGWRCKCPQCGAGDIFDGYLKITKTCPACNEALHHHRADDGPAYLTILIVGHIVVPAMLWGYTEFTPDPMILVTLSLIATVGMSLYLLPRLKGVIVGIQWANRMHGFGHTGT